MPAIISNLGWVELAFIAVIAVLVFGNRLPDVVMEAARHLYRLRRALSDLRRESGLDRELRNVQDTLRRAADVDDYRPGQGLRPKHTIEAGASGAQSTTPDTDAGASAPADEPREEPATTEREAPSAEERRGA